MTTRLRTCRGSHLIRTADGRYQQRSVTSVTAPPNPSRVLNAEMLHGDEQQFWLERRSFYCRHHSPFLPSWDRFARCLILFTRTAPRVPQEAAFRLMALYLKLLLIGRVTESKQLLLPAASGVNVQAILADVLEKGISPSAGSGQSQPPSP